MIVSPVLFVLPRSRRHEKIDTDNRLDPGILAFFIEFDCRIHVATVGKGERRLAICLCRRNEFRYFGKCFEEGIVTMRM